MFSPKHQMQSNAKTEQRPGETFRAPHAADEVIE
jgi:hypothetical protein